MAHATTPNIRKPLTKIPGSAKARIFVGDAFDLASSLTPHSIDLILTSPPYWGHRTYEQNHKWNTFQDFVSKGICPSYEEYRQRGGILGLEPIPDWFILHLAEIFDLIRCALKPEGNLWVNLGDTYFARWASIRENGRQGLGNNKRQRRRVPMGGYRQEKQLLLIPARFAIAMQERKWILRNDLIWHKPNVPPRPESDRLRLAHEHFLHFVKKPVEGRAKYFYDLSAVEPGARDVITCLVRPGSNGHSATFPEEIIRPRILSSCPEAGLVLDPFCGTGTTLAVALAHGRSAVGFELSPQHAASARTRLACLNA